MSNIVKSGDNTPKKGEQGFQKSTKGKKAPVAREMPEGLSFLFTQNHKLDSEEYSNLQKMYDNAMDKVSRELDFDPNYLLKDNKHQAYKATKTLDFYKKAELKALLLAKETADAFNTLSKTKENVDGPHADYIEYSIFNMAVEEVKAVAEQASLDYIATLEATKAYEAAGGDAGLEIRFKEATKNLKLN